MYRTGLVSPAPRGLHSQVFDHRNITQSTFSLLKALLGDFNYEELQMAQWLLAPLLFWGFVGVASFLALTSVLFGRPG